MKIKKKRNLLKSQEFQCLEQCYPHLLQDTTYALVLKDLTVHDPTQERTLTFAKMKNNTFDLKRLNQHGKYSNQIKITYAPKRSMSCFHNHTI